MNVSTVDITFDALFAVAAVHNQSTVIMGHGHYTSWQGASKQVCVQHPTSADNVTLPAFAAECCAAVAPSSHCSRSISPAHRAHSSKSAAVAYNGQMIGWSIPPAHGDPAANLLHPAAAVDRWDRRTDTVLLHRPCCTLCKKYRQATLTATVTDQLCNEHQAPTINSHNI